MNEFEVRYDRLSLLFINGKMEYNLSEILQNLITKVICGVIPINDSNLEVLFANINIQFNFSFK